MNKGFAIAHLFGDHSPKPGDKIVVLHDGEKDTRVRIEAGVVTYVERDGDYHDMVYSDLYPKGLSVSLLYRWRIVP
jgi:hypothetical protein